MYTPAREIVRGGAANVQFTGVDPETRGWNQISRDYIANQHRKYKETDDLYDLQTEQANSFNSMLEGLSGKDYEYQQAKIFEARDRLASLFKGKTLRDTKTPQFQSEYYKIASDLGKIRNAVGTSVEQIKQAKLIAEKSPHFIRSEVDRYLQSQASLPPDQRDQNILERISTDPLFFNAYDYSVELMKKFDKKTFNKEVTTGREVQHWEFDYFPDMGEYNSNGEFSYKLSDTVIDTHLSNPQFYKKMEGMIPASLADSLRKQGNDGALRDAVREQARSFIGAIKSYGPEGRLKSSKMIPQPTATDKKENRENEEVNYLAQQIMSGNLTPLQTAFKSSDYWDGFELETVNGKVRGIKAYVKEKGFGGRTKRRKDPEFFPITNDVFGSVQSILAALKYSSQGDKEKVSLLPPTKYTYGQSPGGSGQSMAGRFNIKKK